MGFREVFVIICLFCLNLVFLDFSINAHTRGDHELSQEISFEDLSKDAVESATLLGVDGKFKSGPLLDKPDIDDQMIPNRGKRTEPSSSSPPSSEQLTCKRINSNNCKIVGKTSFNFYYQISDNETTVSCLSSESQDYKSCNPDAMQEFLSADVLPITTMLNKRVLSVGSKYFILNSADPSSYPVQDHGSVQLGLGNIYNVRLTGGCNITKVSLANPFYITLSSTAKKCLCCKKIGSEEVNLMKFSSEKTIELSEDSLDGTHVLLCGDRVSEIPKIDINKRNCLVKYKGKRYQQSACVHFNLLRYLIVSIILFFPVSWFLNKTKESMFLWYDILGIVLYPLLYALNWIWQYFPLKCSCCGNFSLITHKCYEKCVCNLSKAKKEHAETCQILTGKIFKMKEVKAEKREAITPDEIVSLNSEQEKPPVIKSSRFQTFQTIINTKISSETLLLITKILLGFLIFSQIPKTMAMSNEQALCVNYCRAQIGCSKFLWKNEETCISRKDLKCNCVIGKELISEEAYINGTRYAVSMPNTCMDDTCDVAEGDVENLIVCRLGCKKLRSLKTAKLSKRTFSTGIFSQSLSMNQIYSTLRMQDGYIDSLEALSTLGDPPSDKVVQIDDDIPEGILPRQSFVYSSVVDGKYRYLMSFDAIQSSGYVYSMKMLKWHPPQELVVYVKEAGVTYTIKPLYHTAPISSTHTHVYTTCTGNCETCRKEHPLSGYQDYCISPTSNWGCEELGCLAIGEGSTCGYCRNVYDLSKMYSINQVLSSHVTVKVCFKGFAGATCQTITDEIPYQNSYYQISLDADLHNDDLGSGSRIAIDPNGLIMKGNIANLKDSSTAFGHPQLDKTGKLLFGKANLDLNDFTWSCAVIGSKHVDIKKCGYDTYHQYIGLEPISNHYASEISDEKLFVKKDFKVGKINLIVDLPSELFKQPAKKPKVSLINSECKGCLSCGSGIKCTLEMTSDSIFAGNINWEHCTSEPEYIAMKKGSNIIKVNMFCLKNPSLTKMILEPSGDSDLSLEFETRNVEIIDPETIIDHNDDAFNEEVDYDNDTSFKSLWDYLKSPFNWIASFFGDFFEIVRVLLVLACCVFAAICLSKLFEICREYYKQEHYKKSVKSDLKDMDEEDPEDPEDILGNLKNQITEDTLYRRNLKPKKSPFDSVMT
ncbi:Gn/Gc glycoprotein precursor [Bean necrotic mosaic virus]|uniref:Envelopment polyprotein n=1 Tax=Bean necrotic mosaic virus TaxID=1033976 RepID=I3PCT1_9VIRU|nr:Gn/Gc glycoprotein precursor [Bean necrotic mosaic virus]AER23988.1 Gn/Gc glycoprotein precursor [Bean necrotic mosaic virus]